MISQPEALLAIEPAHLPHYTHSAVIVGSVIIVAIITLVAGVTLAIAHHLVSAGPMTHRDQSLQLHRIEKHEMIRAYLKLTEHAARSDLTVDVIPVPVSDTVRPNCRQPGKPNGPSPSTTDCNSTPTTPNASQTTPSQRFDNDVRRSLRYRSSRANQTSYPFRS